MDKRKKTVFTIAAIILSLIIIELGLQAVALVRGASSDPRLAYYSFRDKEWAKELSQGFNELGKATKYSRFLTWLVQNYQSKYINIDDQGLRRTWNPSFKEYENSEHIFIFGGSTMLGAGARDEYTIASYLSRELNQRQPRYEVFNYGQTAYTFDQEILRLLLLLRDGKRPDYVIFYDGVNDLVAAYDAGEAGALTTEALIRNKLEAGNIGIMELSLKTIVRDYCKSCRIIINIGRAISPKAFRLYPIVGSGYDQNRLEQLASEEAQHYVDSLRFLDQLSQAYGFQYLVFWQPTLFNGDTLVGDEEGLLELDWRMRDKNMYVFYDSATYKVKNLAAKEPSLNFFDISNSLKGRTNQIFLDNVHISEEGNNIVAEKIVTIFKQKFGTL